jgi:hypothetical protein
MLRDAVKPKKRTKPKPNGGLTDQQIVRLINSITLRIKKGTN